MTAPLVLPSDLSFVKITDGTNNAIVTGLDNSVGVYIGTTAPDASSTVHLLKDSELMVTSPAVLYVRLLRKPPVGVSQKPLVVSKW